MVEASGISVRRTSQWQATLLTDKFANPTPAKMPLLPTGWAIFIHSTTLYFAHLFETSIKKGEKSGPIAYSKVAV